MKKFNLRRFSIFEYTFGLQEKLLILSVRVCFLGFDLIAFSLVLQRMGGHRRDKSDSHMPLRQSEIQASFDAQELQVRVGSPTAGHCNGNASQLSIEYGSSDRYRINGSVSEDNRVRYFLLYTFSMENEIFL